MHTKWSDRFSDRDELIVAWADHGTGHALVVLLVQDTQTQKLRLEYLEPGEQTGELHALFDISCVTTKCMKRAVAHLLRRFKNERPKGK